MSTESKSPKTGLWLRVLLGVSLALNLLVVGVVAGAMWRHGGGDKHGPQHSYGSILYRALPDDDRKQLRKAARAEFRDRGARRKQDVDALVAALRAEPFDPSALSDLVKAEAKTKNAARSQMSALWLERVSAMDTETRALYADRLKRISERRKPHKKP